MPAGEDFASIMVIVMGLAFGPTGAASDGVRPPRYQVGGWTASCWAGDDGFAAECEARKRAGGFTLRLSAADSQVYQFLEHPRCRPQQTNIFRDDILALGDQGRRTWIEGNFERMAQAMAKSCPNLPLVDQRAFLNAPDIASAGVESLR